MSRVHVSCQAALLQPPIAPHTVGAVPNEKDGLDT